MLTLSAPGAGSTLEITDTTVGISTTVDLSTLPLWGLLERLPASAFETDTAPTRRGVRRRLDAIGQHVVQGRYRAALSGLHALRLTLEQVLVDPERTDAAGAPETSHVLAAVDGRIARLETLATKNETDPSSTPGNVER